MSNETLLKTTVSSKACSKCGETKPLTDFYAEKRAPDGRYARCKKCHNKATKKWSKENPDRIRELSLAAYHRNRDVNIERMRKWKAENPDKCHGYEQERLAKRSRRVARIRKMLAHFDGRTGWLEKLAAAIAMRSDAQGLCWIAADIDELLLIHFYKEV